MASWSGKSKGGKFGYVFFILLLKYTNIKIVYFFIRLVAFYFLIVSNKNPIRYYFEKIHGYGKLKTIVSIYQNYYLLGQVLIDKISVLSGYKNPFTYDFEGEEFLRKMAEDKKGGLLIGAHIGNWEIAGQLLKRIDIKVNIVMYEAEHKSIKAIYNKYNIVNNATIIPIKDDFSHLFKIKNAFEKHELVVMHGDRFLDNTKTITINFMNKPAKFPVGPFYLASKYKVPISYVYALKETPTHYHFFASKAKQYPYIANKKDWIKNLNNILQDYVVSLEQIIKKYPLQWFNYYYFWNEKIKNKLENQ